MKYLTSIIALLGAVLCCLSFNTDPDPLDFGEDFADTAMTGSADSCLEFDVIYSTLDNPFSPNSFMENQSETTRIIDNGHIQALENSVSTFQSDNRMHMKNHSSFITELSSRICRHYSASAIPLWHSPEDYYVIQLRRILS